MIKQFRTTILAAAWAVAGSPVASKAQEHALIWHRSPTSWERPERHYMSFPNRMLDVAAVNGDDVVVAGEFETSMTFAGRVFSHPAPGTSSSRLFAARLSSDGALLWASDPLDATAGGVATDAHGGFYLSADFRTPAAVGPFSTEHGPVLVRFDDAQQPMWMDRLPGDAFRTPVRTDSSGNAYVATSATAPLTLGKVRFEAGQLGVVTKQRADGRRAWARVFSGSTALEIAALAPGDSAIYVAGNFTGTLSMSATRTSLASTRSRGFVAALSPLDGSLRWLINVPGGTEVRSVVRSIALGSCSDLFIAGDVFARSAEDMRETERMFVTRVNEEGIELWRRDLTATNDEFETPIAMAGSLASDNAGGVLLAAAVSGRVEFDGLVMDTGATGSSHGSALVHLTAQGRARDGRIVGSQGVRQLARDRAGHLLLAGYFWTVGYIDDHRASGRYQELFVAKLDASDRGPSSYFCGPGLPSLGPGLVIEPRLTLPGPSLFPECLVDGPNCMLLDLPELELTPSPVR